MDSFKIVSPAGVPWRFTDASPNVLIGESPTMMASIRYHEWFLRFHRVVVRDLHGAVLASGERQGVARAVAFVLTSGDSLACAAAPRLDWGRIGTSQPSSTASFSQVREFSACPEGCSAAAEQCGFLVIPALCAMGGTRGRS